MKIFDFTIFGIHIAPSYYWLAYVLGFVFWYLIIRNRKILKENEIDTLGIFIFFWIILWARIGYILFYDLFYYISNPLDILKTWQWWMSFHGWVIWVILAMFLFSYKYKKSFLDLADNIVSILPIWLWLGRIWNYLNKELLWNAYSWFLAVEKNWQYYFPSPLVEALFEWLILYFILNYIFKKRKYLWKVWAGFLFFYGIFRFWIEFIRTPDSQIWYLFWWLTMWQILTIPMIIAWIYFWLFFKLPKINLVKK
jgi:phosphatidylglycerol---prolipoprotein diacylglyceryl transferase